MSAVRAAWMVMAWLVAATPAAAHYESTALLHLRELAPGEFAITFTPSTPMRRSVQSVRFGYPAQCREDGMRLQCSGAGLRGELTAEHLPQHGEVIVQVDWRDGSSLLRVLSQRRERTELAQPVQANTTARALTYLRLGIEHIFGGADHVLFVLGLVLVTGFRRQLLATITAFTAAHSITLALDATGLLHVRPMPVEALIAASLVLVACEALTAPDARQRGWRGAIAIAFVFGLFHGLGFGGALRELGVPRADLPLALALFNLGVELGQCALVAGLGLLYVLAQRLHLAARPLAWLRTGAAYVVGGLGGYWFFERVYALIVPGG